MRKRRYRPARYPHSGFCFTVQGANFSVRWGSWLLTNKGLFRWSEIWSRNRKIRRWDWKRAGTVGGVPT